MKLSDETVTAVIVHKLNVVQCLLSMFLSISYSHYELRLGIVSGTELPMMLWFIDVLLMQFSEMEKRYIKGKNGGYE